MLTISLTEVNFEHALADAGRLDDYFALTGQVVGPLHGVPITVKVRAAQADLSVTGSLRQDMYHVKGLDTTIGYCSRAGQIANRDGVFVASCKPLIPTYFWQ